MKLGYRLGRPRDGNEDGAHRRPPGNGSPSTRQDLETGRIQPPNHMPRIVAEKESASATAKRRYASLCQLHVGSSTTEAAFPAPQGDAFKRFPRHEEL